MACCQRSCRSVVLTCLSLVWLPFGAITTSLADVWNTFAKWNQYVREYENTTLQKPKSAEAEAKQSQSVVAEPDMQSGPLQDQIPAAQSTQPLSGGYPLSAHILPIEAAAAAAHAPLCNVHCTSKCVYIVMQRLSVTTRRLQAQLRIRLWRPCKESQAAVHLSTAPEASVGNAPVFMCLLHSR